MACAQNCDLAFIQCFNQCEPIVGSDCTRDCTAELESCKVILVFRQKFETSSIELLKTDQFRPYVQAVMSINWVNQGQTEPKPTYIEFLNLFLKSEKEQLKVVRSYSWSKYPAKSTVAYWQGYTYIYLPEAGHSEKIFLFEGSNIATTFDAKERCEVCFNKHSREAAAYRDPSTGQFLSVWNNTLTGELNEVRPVVNDPVNHHFNEGDFSFFSNSRTNPNKVVNNLPIFLKVRLKKKSENQILVSKSAGRWIVRWLLWLWLLLCSGNLRFFFWWLSVKGFRVWKKSKFHVVLNPTKVTEGVGRRDRPCWYYKRLE